MCPALPRARHYPALPYSARRFLFASFSIYNAITGSETHPNARSRNTQGAGRTLTMMRIIVASGLRLGILFNAKEWLFPDDFCQNLLHSHPMSGFSRFVYQIGMREIMLNKNIGIAYTYRYRYSPGFWFVPPPHLKSIWKIDASSSTCNGLEDWKMCVLVLKTELVWI